mmetsp:Transcript_49136/g.110487  ORF Transcript_49136/g.110487 Transcript_49136/m.110487 type:complete len:343 (+) Transcript_49136:1070-2098(+)
MAASFIRLANDAPENPVVRLATIFKSSSSARGLPLQCTLRISIRPSTSGRSTGTRRSKRPGRNKAASSTSARLVAASTITPEFPSKPSISVRIWLSVCSRSSFPPPMPPPPPARWRPTASISSIKMIHGAFFFASVKRSRTRAAPTPTNISTNSDPDAETNGTPASPATARARRVFPVPGGPSMTAPRGIFAPRAEYFPGFFRNSTISVSSNFDESQPATSANVTPVLGSISSLDFDFPMPIGPPIPPIGPPPPPCPPWRRWRKMSPPMMRSGKARLDKTPSTAPPADGSAGACTAKTTFFAVSAFTSSPDSPGRRRDSWRLPSLSMETTCFPSAAKLTFST